MGTAFKLRGTVTELKAHSTEHNVLKLSLLVPDSTSPNGDYVQVLMPIQHAKSFVPGERVVITISNQDWEKGLGK